MPVDVISSDEIIKIKIMNQGNSRKKLNKCVMAAGIIPHFVIKKIATNENVLHFVQQIKNIDLSKLVHG